MTYGLDHSSKKGEGHGEVRHRNLVGGEACDATGGGTIDSTNPATGTVWAHVLRRTAADVGAAVTAARSAFAGWRRS